MFMGKMNRQETHEIILFLSRLEAIISVSSGLVPLRRQQAQKNIHIYR